jgi:hypothetical protein
MGKSQRKRSYLTRLAVTAAAVLIVVGVLAVPALAAPHGTHLDAHANNTLLTYGGGTIISAVLMDTTDVVALGGQWVRVEQATSAAGPWELLYLVTTDSGAYYTGTYSAAVLPAQNTWYRFVFEATSAYATSTSNTLAIQVKPLLGKPGCPSSIKHGKTFTVRGTLKPAFAAGAKTVKVKAYKLNSHKRWVFYQTFTAKNFDFKGYTQYRATVKLTKTGRYRFRAQTAKTAHWAAAKSSYSRTLTVN